jgi:hypothetical protein
MEQDPNIFFRPHAADWRPKSARELELRRRLYTFPPHPSGSVWDLTPDGYEDEHGVPHFADDTVDYEAMFPPEFRGFGSDSREDDDRMPEWEQMIAAQREAQRVAEVQQEDVRPENSSGLDT